MNPRLRNGLIIAGGTLMALWFGALVAQGAWVLPGLGVIFVATLVAERHLNLPLEGMAVAGGIIGYTVGNRGFAQLTVPGVPLLYAEGMLALLAMTTLAKIAIGRLRVPPMNALNILLLAWIVFGAAWMPLNVRSYGILAVRDFAMVYYGAFFLIAQTYAADASFRSWVSGALTASLWLAVPAYLGQVLWPEFFFTRLAIFETPLIFHKPDLLAVYCAMGTVWAYFRYREAPRVDWIVLFALNLFGVAFTSTRAVFVAMLAVAVLLACCRRTGYAAWLATATAMGMAVLFTVAAAEPETFKQSKFYGIVEHGLSLVDFGAQFSYENAEARSSGDNNQFRLVWWRMVWEETWEENPLIGLGFGYDLGERFIKYYNPPAAGDFGARSPHSFPITVFARMGFLGLGILTAFMGVGLMKTLQCSREGHEDALVWWAMGWTVFVAAAFGVVLEAPMGAVVFWIILGIGAHVSAQAETLESPVEEAPGASDETDERAARETAAVQ